MPLVISRGAKDRQEHLAIDDAHLLPAGGAFALKNTAHESLLLRKGWRIGSDADRVGKWVVFVFRRNGGGR
jgi:hypothetical protein